MNTVGIVSVLLGLIIVVGRGLLLVVPAYTLRVFSTMIENEARTRTFGMFVLALAGMMIWAGESEDSMLAGVLWIVGLFMAMVGAGALVLYPRAYMGLAEAILPDDPGDKLFGWRMLGLIGVVIGGCFCYFGMRAL